MPDIHVPAILIEGDDTEVEAAQAVGDHVPMEVSYPFSDDEQVPEEADNGLNTTVDQLVIQEGFDFVPQPSLIDSDFTIPVEEVKA